MEVRDAVRYLRSELGLTQMELASALRVTPTTIGRWEKGQNLPNRSIAASLMEFARAKSASQQCLDLLARSVADAAKQRRSPSRDALSTITLSELIDGAAFPLYVCDMETDELLYINGRAEEMIGRPLCELSNTKCYACLMHRDSPCGFCGKAELAEDRAVSRETVCSIGGKMYRMQARRIKWNGRDAQVRCFSPSEADRRLKDIAENMNVGVTVEMYGADGTVRHAYRNARYYEMFGYTEEQFAGERQAPYAVVVPEDAAHVRTAMDTVHTTGRAVTFRFRAKKRGGSILHVRCSTSIVSIEGIDERALLSVFTDITETVGTEQRALVFGQRLNAIMDNINNGIVASVTQDDGTVEYVFVTDRYYEMLGFTREQYRKEVSDPFALIHADDRAEVRGRASSLRNIGDTEKLRYRAVRRDGSVIWLAVDSTMMSFSDADKPVMLSVFTDITHIMQANEQLAAQRDQIQEMLNTTPSGLAVIEVDPEDPEGNLRTVFYNERFFSFSGCTREEYDAILKGDELGFVFREDKPGLIADIIRICAGEIGNSVDSTIRCHTRDGGYCWLLLTGQLAERHGKICTVKVSLVDVTLRKEAEDKLRISEAMLRIAAETDKRALITYDVKANTCHVESRNLYSAKFGEMLENIPESLIDTGIVSPESAAGLSELFARIRSGEQNYCVSVQLRTGQGEYQWFECNASTVPDADGKPDRAILVFHNITEQRVKEAVYKKWRQSIEARPPESYTLFRCNLSKGSSQDEQDGKLLRIEFEPGMQIFNERTRAYVEQFVYPEDQDAYAALLDSDTLLAMFYRGEHSAALEYREIGEDGLPSWRLLTVEMVEYLNSTDVQAFLLYEDIDEKKQAELAEIERAETDPLTGIFNRVAFSARVDDLIRREGGLQHAMLMMDMDGFKHLNDTFGHAAGDQALLDTASVMRAMVRDGDLICRLGGDEFLVWLRDIPYDAVIGKIARQLCEQVRKVFSHEVVISASIGVSVYPRDGHDFDELYHSADKALYRVKQSGKNNYAFFSATERAQQPDEQEAETATVRQSNVKAKRRMLIVDDDKTSRAILRNMFRDEYLIEEARNGTEALIRLRHFSTAISVMLLDLNMPGVSGYEVLQKMQANVELRTVPVIVVSGDDDRESLLTAIESGATDYVTKPVDAELIRIRVKSAVSKAENERLRAQNSYLQLQRDEELKYRIVLQSTGTVVVEYDWHNRIFIYDDTISNYIAGNYNHRSLWQVFLSDMVADSTDVKMVQDGLLVLANDRTQSKFSRLILLRTPGNQKHWFRINIYKQVDAFGLAEKMIITFNDVHDEVLSNEKLRFQATRDELTGLYNRAGFIERAAELISGKEPGYYVMACIDIEKFKVINDQYGTEKGDEVLRQFAEVLRQMNRGEETVCCRVMADNFALLYPSHLLFTSELAATHTASETLDGSLPPLKICAGRCMVDDKTLPISAIYDRAAIAKSTIKGRYDAYVATYDESMRTKLLRQQEITGQMRGALAEGQFEVWLQPQFNHSTGMLSGAEALVRWRHPKEGIISPAEFIPIFERNGFVYEMDKYIWEKTCALLRKWLDQGLKPVPVAVNVSRYDVFRADLIAVISGLVDKYGLPRSLLRLEITESAFSESADQIIRVVEELVEMGFVVEIDDFGSGYSSLNTLKDVPAQVLKMDMRFLENDRNAQRGGSIIESVVRMARWLGMSVIAEGVETTQQADYLKSIGCEYVQGYLYARPKQIPEYEQIFSEGGIETELDKLESLEAWNNNAFWNPKSMETLIFNSYVGGACIFEYCGGKTELLRYNDGYAEVFHALTDQDYPANRKDILTVLDAENAARLKTNIETALRTKKESTCENKLIRSDGSECFVRATIRQIAQAGNRSLFYCVVADVTAQRAAERSEREAASRVATIMDSINAGVAASVVQDGAIRYLFANGRYYELMGYDKDSYMAQFTGAFHAIHPDDRDRVNAVIRDATRTLRPYSVEFRLVCRNGEIRWLSCDIRIVRLPDVSEPVHLATVNDTTELHIARHNEQISAERIRAIMDNATSGITAVILNSDGAAEYLLVNDQYFELVGYTREQYAAAGLVGLELMHPDDRQEYERQIVGLNTVGQAKSFEFRAKRRDGRWAWLRDDIAVISLKGVDAPVQLSCFTDITAQRQADERLHFINELASEILAEPENDQAIRITLRRLMTYFDADRSYISELDYAGKLLVGTYEVCADGMAGRSAALQSIPFTEADPWYTTLMRRNFFRVENVDEVEDAALRALLRAQDIRSLVLAPLWRNGRLIGYAGVDNPRFVLDDVERLTAPADYLALLLSRRDLNRSIEHGNAAMNQLIDDVPGGFCRLAIRSGERPTLAGMNGGFCRLLDMTPEEVQAACGEDLYRCFAKEDVEASVAEARSARRSGRQYAAGCRLRKKDGTVIRVRAFGRFADDADGNTYLNIYFTENEPGRTGAPVEP